MFAAFMNLFCLIALLVTLICVIIKILDDLK